ncbi:MAG TPA: deoxynucleoside kinase [Steroidobacteraceae bacterium]|nr:deoxynucleoside kinase [Steroidobacteraceae bacterium]
MSTPDTEASAAAPGSAAARGGGADALAQRYIVIEGPIGVGKTSLAKKLAESLEAELVLEQDAQNPFLERFYRNQKSGALPAQLFFLFQRAQQLGTLKQQDMFAPRRVADYLFEKDRLFAGLTLDAAEMALYEQVASRLAVDPPKPDLVVYLQAPVETLLQRIAKRGISYESSIDAAYLARLNDAYARFFHEFDQSPLLIVNAANIDPVQNQGDYDELVGAIRRMKKGRMYYNPLRHGTI